MVHAKLLNDLIKTVSSDKWDWCLRTNGTYVDCPINGNTNKNFATIVENPSYLSV